MAQVAVQTESGVEASISIVGGISNKTGKPWTAISVQVGKWKTLVFPKSSFELDYVKEQLGA